jgi:uncharacterized phage protein gp47/JayE
MPFDRPTIETLLNRAISDLETRLPGADARLRLSFENAITTVLAGVAHGLHGHLFYLSKQILPDTADEDTVRRWAAVLDVTPTDPSKAVGKVILTGTNSTVAASGTQWRRADGVLVETTASATIAAGTATVAARAVEAGSAGNTAGGTSLAIVTPIAGITSVATVDGDGLTGGADAESVDSLRARVLARLRTPPSGGGPGDYAAWAREVAGVTRAWESPVESGPGTVNVRFAVDGELSPIPSGAKVTEVQTHLDLVAPVTATVLVSAPSAVSLNPHIHLVTSDTAAIRAAVEAELESLLLRDVNKPAGTIPLSQINEAISLAAGEVDHTMSSPAADIVLGANELAVLGTITWS